MAAALLSVPGRGRRFHQRGIVRVGLLVFLADVRPARVEPIRSILERGDVLGVRRGTRGQSPQMASSAMPNLEKIVELIINSFRDLSAKPKPGARVLGAHSSLSLPFQCIAVLVAQWRRRGSRPTQYLGWGLYSTEVDSLNVAYRGDDCWISGRVRLTAISSTPCTVTPRPGDMRESVPDPRVGLLVGGGGLADVLGDRGDPPRGEPFEGRHLPPELDRDFVRVDLGLPACLLGQPREVPLGKRLRRVLKLRWGDLAAPDWRELVGSVSIRRNFETFHSARGLDCPDCPVIPAMPPCSSRTINGSFSIAAVSLGKVSRRLIHRETGACHHRHQKKGRRDSCCARHGLVPHPATGLAVPDPPRNRRYRWGVTPNPEGFPEILEGSVPGRWSPSHFTEFRRLPAKPNPLSHSGKRYTRPSANSCPLTGVFVKRDLPRRSFASQNPYRKSEVSIT